MSKALFTAAVAALVIGCSDEHGASGAATSHTTSAPAATSATAAASSAPAATATASATAAVPRSDCPKDSAGEGTLKAPCDAKGLSRMMEVQWTGKMDDAGPSFRVINKSALTILYGRIVVYFYDKAGKQLEVPDDTSSPPKTKPNQVCFGNLFGGVMKPGEKAVVTFSCVKKKHVPEGTAAIEGELEIVGFADATEKKSEFYWRNKDLVPDTRPKGGIKK